MRKMLLALAATLIAGVVATGAYAQDKMRVVVVTHGQASDPFWSVVKNGVDYAAKTFGITVEYRAPDTFDMVKMAQLIDAAVASHPDGLVVSIPDASALGDSIKNAVAAGIPVISMNSGSDVYEKLGVLVHVGQTEFEAGLGGGKRMAAAGVKKADLHQPGGRQRRPRHALRRLQEGPGRLGRGARGEHGSDRDRQRRQGLLRQEPRHPGRAWRSAPPASEPALQALEDLGLLGQVKLGTFDLSPTVLQAIADGKMMFAIDQQQFLQGYLPVDFLVQYHKFGTLPHGVVMTGPGFVTKDNAKQVIALSKQGIR